MESKIDLDDIAKKALSDIQPSEMNDFFKELNLISTKLYVFGNGMYLQLQEHQENRTHIILSFLEKNVYLQDQLIQFDLTPFPTLHEIDTYFSQFLGMKEFNDFQNINEPKLVKNLIYDLVKEDYPSIYKRKAHHMERVEILRHAVEKEWKFYITQMNGAKRSKMKDLQNRMLNMSSEFIDEIKDYDSILNDVLVDNEIYCESIERFENKLNSFAIIAENSYQIASRLQDDFSYSVRNGLRLVPDTILPIAKIYKSIGKDAYNALLAGEELIN